MPYDHLRIPLGSETKAREVFQRLTFHNCQRFLLALEGSPAYLGDTDASSVRSGERQVPLSSVGVNDLRSIGVGPSHSESGADCLVLQGRFRIV